MGRITQFLTRRPRLGPRAWIGIAAALVVVAVGYLLVAFLIARGTTAAEREPHEGDPGDFGLAFEEVRFKPRDDDLALEGWYVPGAPDGPVVLFVHGQGSQRTGDDILPITADFRLARLRRANVRPARARHVGRRPRLGWLLRAARRARGA